MHLSGPATCFVADQARGRFQLWPGNRLESVWSLRGNPSLHGLMTEYLTCHHIVNIVVPEMTYYVSREKLLYTRNVTVCRPKAEA